VLNSAAEVGIIAPEIILFTLSKEPDTGSRIPSLSTGGAAMKALINTEVAVIMVGII